MKKQQVIYSLLFVCFILFGTTSQIRAATTETVTLSVHKLLFEDGQLPDLQTNGGVLSQEDLPAYRGLNGVTFSLYDVTDHYYSYVKKGLTKEQVRSKIAKQNPTQYLTSGVTETQHAESGIVNFNVPKYKASGSYQGEYAVYLLIESHAPATVKERAAPLVVTLPVYQNDQEESTIHLYPKNEEIAYTKPPFEKQVLDKKNSYAYGDQVSYQITTTIPVDSWNYSTYQISDHADKGLVMKEGSLHVQVGEQKTIDYQSSVEKNGFTIQISPKTLAEFSGEKMTITYEMSLGNAQIEQTDFTNTATLTPGNHPAIKTKTTVKSGRQTLTKVDLKNRKKTLAGAEFIVQNQKGQSLSRLDEKNKWLEVDKTQPVASLEKQVVILTSDTKGNFSINGLPDGTYQLHEIKAPTGYQRAETPVVFNIDAMFPSSEPLSVINQKKNVRWFPKTNDSQQKGLIVLGILLIFLAGGVMVFKWKEKRRRNK